MWGPAWVTWRSGGGCVGWAALPPRGVSVTTTYGHRSPWRFTRAADLGARRLRCLPMRDMKGMFRRTTNVANDRVLWRGKASVHINAGPRYIPNATRAAEDHRAARVPAAGDPAPPGREHVGAPVDSRGARRQRAGPRRLPDGGAGAGGGAAPHALGRNAPGPGAARRRRRRVTCMVPRPAPFGQAVGPQPSHRRRPGAARRSPTRVPRIYEPPPANGPRIYNPPPAAARQSTTRRPARRAPGRASTTVAGVASTRRAATQHLSPPTYAPPRTSGHLPAHNPGPRLQTTAAHVRPCLRGEPDARVLAAGRAHLQSTAAGGAHIRAAARSARAAAVVPSGVHAAADARAAALVQRARGAAAFVQRARGAAALVQRARRTRRRAFGRPGGGVPFGGGHRR